MSIKSDQEYTRRFIETCTADELAKLASFAITNMPCVENAVRRLLKVMVALVKP